MENNILLSLCIPTNGVVEWIIPVIESIYAQGVDNMLFEIVVTDNGEKDNLQEAVKNIKYENFHYYRTTSKGFTNQIDAFEKCNGEFCKMLNHRSKLMPGSIEKMLYLVETYKNEKPIIYCADGFAKCEHLVECANIDEFVRNMSFWVSWSAGTGAWKSDLVDLRKKNANATFPHTLFLFGLRPNSKYVIWNEKYEIMANDKGKGGYNVFEAFGVTFLDLMSDLRQDSKISLATFLFIKKEMYNYLCQLYYQEVASPTNHTFLTDHIREYVKVYYCDLYFGWMVLRGRIKVPLARIKRIILKK